LCLWYFYPRYLKKLSNIDESPDYRRFQVFLPNPFDAVYSFFEKPVSGFLVASLFPGLRSGTNAGAFFISHLSGVTNMWLLTEPIISLSKTELL